MSETKRDDIIDMLIKDLRDTSEKLFAVTQVRGTPEHSDLMKNASVIMNRAADWLERTRN